MLIKDKYPDTILSKLFGEQTYIPPVMGPSNRLAVAEAAGAEENATGLPLVGGSGKIFDSLLRKAGIRRDDISIINTLPCQPPLNLYPTDTAARVYCTTAEAQEAIAYSYEHYVEPVLKARPWTRIDAIGEKSLRLLTGKTEGIMKWRGSPLPLKGEDKARVIGILHPSYLMRDSSMIPATISDLSKGTQIPPQHYNVQPTLADLEDFNARTLVFDIETNRFTQQITMVGIADARRKYHVVVVPFHGAYIKELKRIFYDAEELVGQNIIGFDLDHLKEAGVLINPTAQIWDIMLMYHLIQPDAPHDLEFIASIFTQMVAWKQLSSVDMPWYNGCDVDATAQSFTQLLPLLRQFDLERLYKLVQVPLAKICKQMSETGIKVDPNRISAAREKFLAEFKTLESQLPKELQSYDKTIKVRQRAPEGTLGKSGKPVKYIHIPGTKRVDPWNSPKLCEKWLYETMQYPKQLHPKTKKVTASKQALDRLFRKTGNKQLMVLKDLKSLDEILSTFLKEDNVGKSIPTSRVHSGFLVHGTNTGRLSSSHPNMQNIPKEAKFAYVPSFADWCFVECVAPETRILDAELVWRRADSFSVGDAIIGFDEESNQRRTKPSIVTAIRRLKKHSYRLITNKGTIVAALDHSFVVKKKKTNTEWQQVKDIEEGDEISFFVSPWEEDKSNEGGWFAGLLDGEGYSSSHVSCAFGQNEGLVLQKAKTFLTNRTIEYNINETHPCKKIEITGEAFAGLKTIGTFRPIRLLEKAKKNIYGLRVWGKLSSRAKVLKKEYVNIQDVIAIETTTHTYFAEGMLSHNCDFSGIENNLAAWYANDTDRLARLAIRGFSEHKWLCSKIFGIPESEISKSSDEYDRAKHTNHGADAGMGPRKMSMQYNIPEKDCRNLLLMWKTLNHKSAEWQERTGNQAIKDGILTTVFGRKRWFWSQSGYTEGIRFLLQSTAADICFRAMIALCYERIGWPIEEALKVVQVLKPLPIPARLVLQVHDSLLIECPYALVDEVKACMKAVMEQPWPELAGYSIMIDTKTGAPGDSWGELKIDGGK